MNNKRVVVLSGTRFENLLNKDNFLTRNDAESMNRAKKALDRSLKKDEIEAYLNTRMLKASHR
ncbi:TPA: hypothetical protein P0O07_004115 [Yersinia enterocolitica]|jgi:hypothetical protein|nr:hypothetical protein [Yersinia enterocolitica]HDL7193974.1 hypothetical protein [Yersinia enterocolitica]HDL7435045.1 hypothetical protein [Yersinia enterocolitica]HDL8308375.1 hypothetical protein [Yersinia enterocolitica]HDM8423694.1 hypothetical protein [Yersinia enterocolitica]